MPASIPLRRVDHEPLDDCTVGEDFAIVSREKGGESMKTRKLVLNRETLRSLATDELHKVHGGATGGGVDCQPPNTNRTLCKACVPPGP
jgi:hypothetical protein